MATLLFFLFIVFFGCKDKDDNLRQDETIHMDLKNTPKEIISKEKLPEWLIVVIDKLAESKGNRISIYKGELKERVVYYVSDTFNSCVFCNVYYEDGEHIVDVSTLDEFRTTSKGWVLIYEFPDDAAKEILQALVTGYEGKLKYENYFRGIGFRSNVYSRAHVVSEMSNQLFQKENNPAFLSGMADESTIKIIDELK